MIVCPSCDHIHAASDVTALGRFSPSRPIGYRAAYPGAPVQPSRAAAEQDMCNHHAETKERDQ